MAGPGLEGSQPNGIGHTVMSTTVTIDKDRIVAVDGKPFFLVGARHMPTGGSPAILAEAGFNARRVRTFGVEKDPESDPIPDPDEGLYFWDYLYDRTILDRAPDYRRELEAHVRQVREHPLLFCYENTNEVARFWKTREPAVKPEELVAGTDLVRELDPDHPIWIAHTRHRTVETLSRYSPFGDITGCNTFPIAPMGMRRHVGVRADGRVQDCPDSTLHSVGKYADKMMRVGGGKLAVFMQIQAMAYENWFSPEHSPELAGQTVDESLILYPTYEDIRFMAFDAIIHGATGLVFALYKTPVGGAEWDNVVRVVRELRGLERALTGTPVTEAITTSYADLGFTIWDGVVTLARRCGDDVFVFAANTAFDPAEATFRSPLLDGHPRAAVEGEDREVPIAAGTFTDAFDPFAVHVYRLPGD